MCEGERETESERERHRIRDVILNFYKAKTQRD